MAFSRMIPQSRGVKSMLSPSSFRVKLPFVKHSRAHHAIYPSSRTRTRTVFFKKMKILSWSVSFTRCKLSQLYYVEAISFSKKKLKDQTDVQRHLERYCHQWNRLIAVILHKIKSKLFEPEFSEPLRSTFSSSTLQASSNRPRSRSVASATHSAVSYKLSRGADTTYTEFSAILVHQRHVL